MKTIKTLLLFITTFAICSCGGVKKDKAVITVSIEPLRYFVEQIVGDKAEVVTLVPKESSPETYEPTAQQVIDLSKSTMYIKVGSLGFERTWGKKIESYSDHLAIIDSSAGVSFICSSASGIIDQHTWMSTANALIIAKNIYNALVRTDSQNTLYYKQRYDALVSRITRLDLSIRKALLAAPNHSFLIYHPALTYFAKDYSLTQLALEEDGREPSAASLAKLITNAKKLGTKLMFVQKEFDNRNREIITIETGVKTVDINPLDYNWDKQMTLVANALADTTAVKQQ